MKTLEFPKKLLAVDTNAKTIKGNKYGFLTGILYFAPSDISGHQVCPMAQLAKCEAPCLFTAGRGAMNSVQKSRLTKTLLFHSQRQEFMTRLAADIERLFKKAQRKGMIPLVRLNGTSDIRWENVRFQYQGQEKTLFEIFPDVQFYDYTKLSNRKDVPANYDLTFSYSGSPAFQKYVETAKAAGMRIAVVFRSQGSIPSHFMGLECVDGDNSDIRHLDPRGCVVALYAKGKAKKDVSGFVVDTERKVIPIAVAA